MDDVRQALTRLRWRLRGATQWPALWLCTLAEAVFAHLVPVSGEHGANIVAAFLVCGFLNLAIVAIVGPLGGIALRRHRPSLPRMVAADRVATLALVAGAGIVAGLGIGHHGAVRAASRNDAAQLRAARAWFAHHAPPAYRVNLGHESVWKQAGDLYRTCLPGRDPHRNLCVFVDLSGEVPAVTEDPDERPNDVIAGPGNPGRLTS
jgi:hypothetical protein